MNTVCVSYVFVGLWHWHCVFFFYWIFALVCLVFCSQSSVVNVMVCVLLLIDALWFVLCFVDLNLI